MGKPKHQIEWSTCSNTGRCWSWVSVLNFMMNSDVGCRIVLRTKVVSLKVLPCNQITTTVSHVRAQIL
jgi:hypothetical protein